MNRIAFVLVLVFLHISCHKERNIYAVDYIPVTAGKCKSDTLNTYHYTRPVRPSGKPSAADHPGLRRGRADGC